MRVIKSVSLPVELAEKVEQMPNFSVFVQECIQYEADAEQMRQRRLAAAMRRIAIREAAIYRIFHKLGFSKQSKTKIGELLESMGIYIDELEDF